jgi:Flp pilus assembly protein TadD
VSPRPTSYEQRGLAYYQSGQREAAREDWCQALRLDPRRTFALINLGWLAIEERRFNHAVDYCTWAIKAEPTNAKAYENRARAYFELGDMVRGYADLQRSRELVMTGEDTSDRDLYE